MSEEQDVYALRWNNNMAVLQFEKEVEFVWERQWSLMSYAYLVVRYFGLFLAMLCAFWGGLLYMPKSVSYGIILLIQWGFSAYFCLAEVILIWRLYALYHQSKLLLYVLLGFFLPVVALYIAVDIFLYSRPSAFSVQETITPHAKYCEASFNMGPMPAIYASIPVICFDILLAILAVVILVKHLRERREVNMKPNTYVVMIVRYHIIYFVLNLASQVFSAIMWADLSMPVLSLIVLFNDTAPFIIAPRLIISIWDTHANDNCIHVSTTFADCVCWTSPPRFDEQEMD
ncbi:uncharacterized protein EDB91DRAFT_1337523 [Suillus paluster]|uniref:uncharacterized protein n=1 Tax=Suillus paluster TaxID=48578 RepID=UPI001B882E94|nr:uncharacterized protein EDB91DRAFT_1337523 [Suillus paluster]KAG1735894.1 hypothetical protein EDB91DRAFT_1337523 [Suillus paluster]